MSSTVNEVIREIKYLKLQRKNSDEIQDLSDQVKTLTQDQEKLAQANLKLIREIKKVLGKEEVNQIEEPEEDEDQEEFEDDEEEEEEEEEEEDEDEDQDTHDQYFTEEQNIIENLVDQKYHLLEDNDDKLYIKNPEKITFDFPKSWKVGLEIKYVPLLNGKFCGGWNYNYDLGGHHSPIEFVRRQFDSVEQLKENFIKIFLQSVQTDYANGKLATSLGKNASGIFKYFDKYTHLLIDEEDQNQEITVNPEIESKSNLQYDTSKKEEKPKKKPNKKETIKDTSKGILKEYHEIFNKINYQDATKFETMINLFEAFSNKMKSIKNYPDRELKRSFVFHWANSKFEFCCKNVVQFESDFLEFFKKMGRKKASLFYPHELRS